MVSFIVEIGGEESRAEILKHLSATFGNLTYNFWADTLARQ